MLPANGRPANSIARPKIVKHIASNGWGSLFSLACIIIVPPIWLVNLSLFTPSPSPGALHHTVLLRSASRKPWEREYALDRIRVNLETDI
jgi:hypothetical protein